MKSCTVFLVAWMSIAGSGIAQTVNASLGGTVTDASGAMIPGATVTATGIDTGVASKTITNESGAYQFVSLQAGNYRVVAEITGFQKVTYDPVALNSGANVRLNFKLPVAGAATTLEVTAAAESPLLATTSVVSGLLTGKQILDMPLIDRSATNLALTQAALAGGIGTGVSVAGGTVQSLMVTLNGINISNTRLNRAGGLESFQFSQSVDMVEEVKVVTSPADVETGRALGQVQMIVRSGTNEFHGSVVDGIRNTAFNANTFWNNFAGLKRQDLKRHQFAARIGGPIIKNKTFFFFLYDGNRQRTSSSSNQTVLTALARQGTYRFFPGVQNGNTQSSVPTVDSSGNPVKPAAATGDLQTVSLMGRDPNRPVIDTSGVVTKLLGQTPLPNNYLIGDGLNTAGYQWQVPAFANRNQFTFKVDHNLSNTDHLNVVVTRERQSYLSTAQMYPAVVAKGVSEIESWYLSLGLTSAFKPTVLNEFRFGFQHPDIDQVGGTRAYPDIYPINNSIPFTPTFSSFTSPIPTNIDASLVNPVYTVSDSLAWIRGNHSFKWGFQFNAASSNSWNINNGYIPSATFGAGSVAVAGISTIPGIGQNQTLAQNILTDLTGSVSAVGEGFGVANGKTPKYIPYRGQRWWKQRDMSFFFKDDFKLASNFTLNYGIRWDYIGVPYDGYGRTPAPINGFGGLFGISGTDYSALWTPGAAKGSLMQIQTVGPNSANSDKQIYQDYYKGFAPALGFSWSLPYFGKDMTVLRMGYGWSRPRAQSFLGIDTSVTPFGNTVSYAPTTACASLSCLNLPLTPSISDPLGVLPLTDRTQSFSGYDPNFVPPLVQNWNVSLERQLNRTMTLAVRYVGNITTHLTSGTGLNAANIFENGILDAFQVTQAGGNAALFDKLFNGLNLGLGAVNGTTVTGSASVRQYSTTKAYLNANAPGTFANWLFTTNALTGVRGGLMPRAGLPDNWIAVNPQYASVSVVNSTARSSYNAAVIEFQKRFSAGWNLQTNFTWAKTLTMLGSGTSDGSNNYRNPRNWKLDKSLASYDQSWAWKANGSYVLPFGKGKKFLNGTSGFEGFLGKVVGLWQLGGILNVASGTPLQITAPPSTSSTAAGSFTSAGTATASLVGSMPSGLVKLTRVANGVVYFPSLTQITDPSVANLTTLQSLQSSSALKAIAYNGTPLLMNPASGTVGNLPLRTTLRGPGTFSLDMNLGKTFRIKERYSVEFRVDAISITNTVKFADPTTNINSTSFGRITAFASNGSNQFTMPSIFNGNRVLVMNLRVSF
jgi:hypothetical protein